MKIEETSEKTTILVEAHDGKGELLRCISVRSRAYQPLIIILPENASRIFRRSSDLRMLKLLQKQAASTMALIIPESAHNERLHFWACQQGIPVFGSLGHLETSAREVAPRRLTPREPFPVQQPALRSVTSPARYPQRRQAQEFQASSQTPMLVTTVVERQIARERITTAHLQPLPIEIYEQARIPVLDRSQAMSEKTNRWDSASLSPEGELVWLDENESVITSNPPGQPFDTVTLVLVVLMILGIAGGLGFGYLLTLTHSTMQTGSAVPLFHPDGWRSIFL